MPRALLFTSVLFAFLFGCASAAACTPPARWNDRPVKYVINDDMPDRCKIAAEEAAVFWGAQGVQYLDVEYRDGGWIGFHGLEPRGTITVTKGPLSPGVAGETRTSRLLLSPSSLASANIVLAICNDDAARHEVGHALGLDHHNVDGFVMCWTTGCGGLLLTDKERAWVR